MSGAAEELAVQAASLIPRIGASLFVLVLFWLAGLLLSKLLHRIGERTHRGEEVLSLTARTVKIAVVFLGVVTALGTVGVDVTALVAGLGLTGFALGFALRDALSNLLAGVLILAYRPFRRGQHIEVTGISGTVMDIDLRYTTLQSEGRKALIPNSNLFTNVVIVMD